MKAAKPIDYTKRMQDLTRQIEYLLRISRPAEHGRTSQQQKDYAEAVWNLTSKQPIHSLTNFDKRSKGYRLNHIVSIKDGFKHNIQPHHIAHITNLQIFKSSQQPRQPRKPTDHQSTT